MTQHDAVIYKKATKNGCRPIWRDGLLGWAWHCTCANEIHFCNQQCSAITITSAAYTPRRHASC